MKKNMKEKMEKKMKMKTKKDVGTFRLDIIQYSTSMKIYEPECTPIRGQLSSIRSSAVAQAQ